MAVASSRLAAAFIASAFLLPLVDGEDPVECSDQASVGRCLFTGCFVHLYGPSHCVNTHCYCKPGYCTTNNRSCIEDPKPPKFKPTYEIDNGCEDIHKGTDTYKATFDKHTFAVGNGNFSLLRDVYHPDAILEAPKEVGGSLCGIDAIIAFYEGFFRIWSAPGSTAQARRDDTVCPEASLCMSFRSYSLNSHKAHFPMASDTIVYSPRGQILFQSFAGKNILEVPVHPHLAKGRPLSGCTSTDHDTGMYEEVLQRHLNAVATKDLDDVMNNYHPDAVFIYRNQTVCGTDDIRHTYSLFFQASEYLGGEMNVQKKTTTCATGFSCQSYVWYSTPRYSQAVDVFLYNAHGQIVSHTWDGMLVGADNLASLDEAIREAHQVDTSWPQTIAPVAMFAVGVAMFSQIWKAQRRLPGREPLIQSA